MKQILLTALLLLGAWRTMAQMSPDSVVRDAQHHILEKLERGEAVQETDLKALEAAFATKEKSGPEPTRKSYTFAELYEKYATREGFTSVHYGEKMMQMMADRVQEEDKELARLLRDIRSIRVVKTTKPDAEFEADAHTCSQSTPAASLLSHLVEAGQTTDCYLIDGGKWNPSTFLMLSFGKQEQAVLSISGYFSVKDISRLSAIRPR